MTKPDPSLERLMQDPKAAGLLKNRDLLKRLMTSPDTQKLMELLNQSAGDGLKSAAAAAARGDASALAGMVGQLMRDPEGARLMERIQQTVPQEKA